MKKDLASVEGCGKSVNGLNKGNQISSAVASANLITHCDLL